MIGEGRHYKTITRSYHFTPYNIKVDILLARIFLDFLTPREFKILGDIASGKCDYQREDLGFSFAYQTLQNHLRMIRDKFRMCVKSEGNRSFITRAVVNYIAVHGTREVSDVDHKISG